MKPTTPSLNYLQILQRDLGIGIKNIFEQLIKGVEFNDCKKQVEILSTTNLTLIRE
jgi:hypothetical protein